MAAAPVIRQVAPGQGAPPPHRRLSHLAHEVVADQCRMGCRDQNLFPYLDQVIRQYGTENVEVAWLSNMLPS